MALNRFGVDAESVYLVKVNFVNLLAYDLDKFGVAFKLDVLNLHLINFGNDARVVWSQHLSTIVPISLVAVVLLGVVACGKNNTTLATKVTNCK